MSKKHAPLPEQILIDELGKRQTGRTKRQMLAAPNGAVYIWVNSAVQYPKALAHSLGRDDLVIKSPVYFEQQWRGSRTPIVLDHAAFLAMSNSQRDGYFKCEAYLALHAVTSEQQPASEVAKGE